MPQAERGIFEYFDALGPLLVLKESVGCSVQKADHVREATALVAETKTSSGEPHAVGS